MNTCFLLTVLFVVPGCGSGDWGTVSGTVTLDGQPLKKGEITFTPAEKGAPAYGQISNGGFTMQTGTKSGLKAGKYAVTVMDMLIPDPDSGKKVEILTPTKYADATTTDFKVEVKPGANTFKFEMKSK